MSLPLSTTSSANFALSLAVIQPSVTAAPVADATCAILSAATLPASTAASASRFARSAERSLHASPPSMLASTRLMTAALKSILPPGPDVSSPRTPQFIVRVRGGETVSRSGHPGVENAETVERRGRRDRGEIRKLGDLDDLCAYCL